MVCVNRLVLSVLLVVVTLWTLCVSLVCRGSTSLLDQALEPRQDPALIRQEECARMKRIAAKKALIRQLEHGEITLYQAAVQFRILNAEPPQLALPGCLVEPASSAEERLCREVLLLMQAESRYRPELSQLAASLEQQMEDDRSQDGAIFLPEP